MFNEFNKAIVHYLNYLILWIYWFQLIEYIYNFFFFCLSKERINELVHEEIYFLNDSFYSYACF